MLRSLPKEIHIPNWEYIEPDGIVRVQGRLSEDLDLFYDVEDVRQLFNWEKPEYQNICKLMSQQVDGLTLDDFPEKEHQLLI